MFANVEVGTKVEYMLPGPDDDYLVVCNVIKNSGDGLITIRLIDDFVSPDGKWAQSGGTEYDVTGSDIYPIK